MTRSGYEDDCENPELYRGNVYRSINGKRGQTFLREMAKALDSMDKKELMADVLVDHAGVCAIGAVLQSRGIDTNGVDIHCPHSVAKLCGIAPCLAAEIEYMNDEEFYKVPPPERWQRMRKWVQQCLDGKVKDDSFFGARGDI